MDAPGTQKSGIKFQETLIRILELAGCNPRDISIVGQQIDASCWIASLPVLIEMLNSKSAADSVEVRDLSGKLNTRPASVIGVLCAPGGFTAGAQAAVTRLANVRTILLWGRAEIEQILQSPSAISQFFVERYRAFIDGAGEHV